MNYEIRNKGAFSLLDIKLDTNETVRLETGSVVYHNGRVEITGKRNGGFMQALGKSLLGGENFFLTTAKGLASDAMVSVAPAAPGDIKIIQNGDIDWYLNDGAFLACDETVTYDMQSQGFSKAMFSQTGGFFIMKTSGHGELAVASFGDIIEIELNNEEFVVDNGHLLAWQDTISYTNEMAGNSMMTAFKTGEIGRAHV